LSKSVTVYQKARKRQEGQTWTQSESVNKGLSLIFVIAPFDSGGLGRL